MGTDFGASESKFLSRLVLTKGILLSLDTPSRTKPTLFRIPINKGTIFLQSSSREGIIWYSRRSITSCSAAEAVLPQWKMGDPAFAHSRPKLSSTVQSNDLSGALSKFHCCLGVPRFGLVSGIGFGLWLIGR